MTSHIPDIPDIPSGVKTVLVSAICLYLSEVYLAPVYIDFRKTDCPQESNRNFCDTVKPLKGVYTLSLRD